MSFVWRGTVEGCCCLHGYELTACSYCFSLSVGVKPVILNSSFSYIMLRSSVVLRGYGFLLSFLFYFISSSFTGSIQLKLLAAAKQVEVHQNQVKTALSSILNSIAISYLFVLFSKCIFLGCALVLYMVCFPSLMLVNTRLLDPRVQWQSIFSSY